MTDPATCPACGGRNQCALTDGSSAPCWCFSVEVSAAALAALPEAERGRACLCPRCANLTATLPGQPQTPSDAG
ncbi:cysteine-rich CWC family protein [Pseudomonas sp. RIT-PI-S]|uniref:cysteine-rich CWC family protein n=1 Tax=Pseudomonas sp. RIT-PI-S TaxID=3035295 RepID=UPI0021D8B941|nr:cysteine-rich CWC family protein [Pseudomonas sp. RIT-PI-S]